MGGVSGAANAESQGWEPTLDKFELYISASSEKLSFQNVELNYTEDELAANAGEFFDVGNIFLWGKAGAWPGMPPKGTSVTCRQITAAGGCFIFDAKMTSRSLDYRATETGKILFEDTPQFCRPNGTLQNRDTIDVSVSSQGRCYWEVELATPSEFGVFANIFFTSQTRADEPRKVLGTQELGYQVIVNEVPDNPDPVDPDPEPPVPTWDIANNTFGEVPVFTPQVQKVKLINTSDVEVPVNSVKVKSDADDQWRKFDTQGCEPVIQPNSSCRVEVQFFPRSTGPQAAVLDVDLDIDQNMDILLTGEGVYTAPDPVSNPDNPDTPVVPEPGPETKPKNPQPPATGGQQVEETRPGTYEVTTKKNKVKVNFTPPTSTEFTVSGYEWRKKRKPSGTWTSWKFIDPEPNENGLVKSDVRMKKSGRYKVQLRSSTPQGFSPKKQITVCANKSARIPTKPGNG